MAYKVNGTDEPTLNFLEEYPIALDKVSIKDVWLHCKHITTNNDDFESLKIWFLTLGKMLTPETPYVSLKDEVKVIEKIKRSVDDIMCEENRRTKPTRTHDMELKSEMAGDFSPALVLFINQISRYKNKFLINKAC